MRIRRDLENLMKVCYGETKQTNESRALLGELNKGELL